MDKEAIEYLNDLLKPFRTLPDHDNIDSELIAHPRNVMIQSLEEFQVAPNAIKQDAKLCSADSFCDYINRFGNGDTTIYLDVDNGQFLAVLDHHGAKAPKWGRHKASFAPQLSLQWQAWRGAHKQVMSQVVLAQFIEERIGDIERPAPGEVLKAALDFQSNAKLVLGSTHSLDDGSVQFTFTKDNVHDQVVFPHRIAIYIPVHANEEATLMDVRIRYRVDGDGALAFVMSMVRDPDTVVREQLLKLAANIRGVCDDKHVYEGRL